MRAVAIADLSCLADEEREIVYLVAQGYEDWQIALKLSSSKQAVMRRLRSIVEKLGVEDRLELALLAWQERV